MHCSTEVFALKMKDKYDVAKAGFVFSKSINIMHESIYIYIV